MEKAERKLAKALDKPCPGIKMIISNNGSKSP
jgi:hypothetical protein